jgi:hypothetical protein
MGNPLTPSFLFMFPPLEVNVVIAQNGQRYSCGTSRMGDVHNLAESEFVSNKNLGQF